MEYKIGQKLKAKYSKLEIEIIENIEISWAKVR